MPENKIKRYFSTLENRRKFYGILSIVIIVALFIVITVLLLPQLNTLRDNPDAVREYFSNSGIKGRLVFIGLQFLQVFISIIPGEFIELAAGYSFGTFEGTLLSYIGVFIASSLVFLLVKKYGTKIVDVLVNENLKKKLTKMTSSPKRDAVIFILYFIPGTPKDIFNFIVPLTPIKFWRFMAISLIARLPSVISSTISGSLIGQDQYTIFIIIYASTAVISVIGALVYKKFMNKHTHNKELAPLQYRPLTPQELKPAGWLREQLVIQANGLSGNLDKVWADISQSKWLGGDRDGWERLPYWLDGYIPLAYLLDDADMKDRAKKYIDYILMHQQEDGWLCPCLPEERKTYDLWAVFLICKTLTVYYDCTGDGRAIEAVYKALRQLDAHIDENPLSDWGRWRWFECLIPIYRVFAVRKENWLLELAEKLHEQGRNYKTLYENWSSEQRTEMDEHVVNVAMSLKAEALYSRISGYDPDETAKKALAMLTKLHSMPTGHFTGDEHLSGDSPLQGTELCGVVEAMYSYEQLLSISGNRDWAERLEALAFNALPAAFTPDMWAHQYDQMTNQIECTPFPEGRQPFRTNSEEAHIFGLEPHFGCCTANFSQGWPKFALSTFMTNNEGLYSLVLAPSSVDVSVKGTKVRCTLETGYPFRDELKYTITAESPIRFKFGVRIPKCALSATVNGKNVRTGNLFIMDRKWKNTTEIIVKLTFKPEFIKRPNDMAAAKYGPLIYSVKIDEHWERREYTRDGIERKYPYCDYWLTPCSPWNYAFASDTLEVILDEHFTEPFDGAHPPVYLLADMVQVPWDSVDGHCAPKPGSLTPVGDVQKIKLIPYGCTNLRMTEMPFVNL